MSITTLPAAPTARDARCPVPTPKAKAAKPEREWRWVFPPTDMAAGYLVIAQGKQTREYRVKLLERDTHCELWQLQRLDTQADGSEVVGELYSVSLGGHHDSCTCKGYEFARGTPRACRHTTTLREAIEWLDNQPVEGDAATGDVPF